jgi:hypothetical protein
MITRKHFNGYRPVQGACPPMHVESANRDANWHPLGRPLQAGGTVGPHLIIGGTGMPCLGIDPTDPTTWEGRGYHQSAGMIGRFNLPDDSRLG